jgi:hypothetical protein
VDPQEYGPCQEVGAPPAGAPDVYRPFPPPEEVGGAPEVTGGGRPDCYRRYTDYMTVGEGAAQEAAYIYEVLESFEPYYSN